MSYLNRADIIAMLKKERGPRTLDEFSSLIGVPLTTLSDVLSGRRAPSDKILAWLTRNDKKRTLEEQKVYVYVPRRKS